MKNCSVLPEGTDFHCFFSQAFHQQKHRLKDQVANFIVLFIKKKLQKERERERERDLANLKLPKREKERPSQSVINE